MCIHNLMSFRHEIYPNRGRYMSIGQTMFSLAASINVYLISENLKTLPKCFQIIGFESILLVMIFYIISNSMLKFKENWTHRFKIIKLLKYSTLTRLLPGKHRAQNDTLDFVQIVVCTPRNTTYLDYMSTL